MVGVLLLQLALSAQVDLVGDQPPAGCDIARRITRALEERQVSQAAPLKVELHAGSWKVVYQQVTRVLGVVTCEEAASLTAAIVQVAAVAAPAPAEAPTPTPQLEQPSLPVDMVQVPSAQPPHRVRPPRHSTRPRQPVRTAKAAELPRAIEEPPGPVPLQPPPVPRPIPAADSPPVQPTRTSARPQQPLAENAPFPRPVQPAAEPPPASDQPTVAPPPQPVAEPAPPVPDAPAEPSAMSALLGVMVGGTATSSPSISLAGAVSVGVFWNRWSLSITGDLALPQTRAVTINPERSGTLTAWNFSGSAAVGYCFGSLITVCPALAGGVRGLAVQPTGSLYQQATTLGVIPTMGVDLQVRWRVSSTVALGARLAPMFPLGSLKAVVEGTTTSFSTSLVEGTFGLALTWSPQFSLF